MRDYFFQIILFLLGGIIGVWSVIINSEKGQKKLLLALGVFLVIVSVLWMGYEWGFGEREPVAQSDLTRTPTTGLPSTKTDNPTQIVFVATLPLSSPTSVHTPIPIDIPTPAPLLKESTIPDNWVIYDFEDGTEGWGSSEGNYKLVQLESSDQEASTGSRSLLVKSQLSTKEDIFTHTEATAYFSTAILGMETTGPYNLDGKKISCDILFDKNFPNAKEVGVRIFVKDDTFHNQFSEEIFVDNNIIRRWSTLSLLIGSGKNTDQGFDPSKIFSVGVRVVVHTNALQDGEYTFFVDNCRIQTP